MLVILTHIPASGVHYLHYIHFIRLEVGRQAVYLGVVAEPIRTFAKYFSVLRSMALLAHLHDFVLYFPPLQTSYQIFMDHFLENFLVIAFLGYQTSTLLAGLCSSAVCEFHPHLRIDMYLMLLSDKGPIAEMTFVIHCSFQLEYPFKSCLYRLSVFHIFVTFQYMLRTIQHYEYKHDR